MSWFSGVVDVVTGWFSSNKSESSSTYHSSSTTQTIYEPDRIRAAELELQRSELLIEGQREIIELNARMQAAVIEANARGFEHSANVLKSLMHDMNLMAQQRLTLLENGHFEIAKNIESLYHEFEREIQKDNYDFQLEKLPAMFEVLGKFPENSTAHKMYANSIDKQIVLNESFVAEKMKGLMQRQQLLIESSVASKQLVLEHSAQIVNDRMKFLESQCEHRKTLALNAPEHLKAIGQDKAH
jgi:hypothetical protein